MAGIVDTIMESEGIRSLSRVNAVYEVRDYKRADAMDVSTFTF